MTGKNIIAFEIHRASGASAIVFDATGVFGVNDCSITLETYVTITIRVREGYCAPEGVFERTPVGEVAVYQCSLQGSYVGSQKRACVLGKKDGEWQQATGFCMPILGMIAIILGAIIVVAMVIFILTRSRKTKAVGGVKSKGGKASKTSGAKKSAVKSTKAVKV